MCGLCGILGSDSHWSDSASNPALAKARQGLLTRRQERLRRAALASRVLSHYGLSLRDWQGSSYVLRGRTGRAEVVDHLGSLWPLAEAMAKRPCDPLDLALLEELEGA